MISNWYVVGFMVDVVLFDFAKPFNVVSHHLLLDKVRLLDICSPLIDWIADFLIGCVLKFSVLGVRSSFMDIRSSVPQGSVLGLLLFHFFVNH